MSAKSKLAAATGLDALVGPLEPRRAQRREREWAAEPLPEVLEQVARRCGPGLPAAEERPLFIFSAGWRSGSTLLQRLVNSSGEYVIWGEPYARADYVARLVASLRPISPWWPSDEDVVDPAAGDGAADRWTANLHPPLAALVEAHRDFFRTLFAVPGAEAPSWGFKEVRLGGEEALYLKFLFPRCRILFLVRDPADAYASYRLWRSWYRSWPEGQVRTPAAYGRLWGELACSFAARREQLGAFLVRYEDLHAESPAVAELEEYLGAPVDRGVLSRRIRGSSRRPQELSRIERRQLRRGLGGAEREFGYEVGR